ncbi:hypothetical protein [Yinghuangia soli]|uniref:Uncharacterized protein n=1 Tax=Yinghuangia soli TaxID=2908204 RepID=A0AA41Q6F1_9ACTN|nr:hypothetical protein [Yinghuangia soli]MCF2532373.1 hypothetical protein [Yinghuangia soli]
MSNFLDKAKEKAKETMATGKQKADDFQANRAQGDLYKQLGAAYYAEQRQGASHDEVSRLLGLLDEHERAHGPSTGDRPTDGPGPVGLA